jgi:cold shock CspA family protein
MTGTIRTLRVDKGFGFIKDTTGKEYFFHQSTVRDLGTCARVTVSNSTLARGRKGLGPKTFGARQHRTCDAREARHLRSANSPRP